MANQSANALYSLDAGRAPISLSYLPSLPTFEGLPILPLSSVNTLVFANMASIPAANHTAVASPQSMFPSNIIGTQMDKIEQTSSVIFVRDIAPQAPPPTPEQASSPVSMYSAEDLHDKVFVSPMPPNLSAIFSPMTTSESVPSPVLPAAPLPTPHISPATTMPVPPSGFSLQNLNHSLATVSDTLASLDHYHRSLENHISSQQLRRIALQAELERYEREARRARLLAKLSRFERARASQDATLVRRKSSGARRPRRSRRMSEDATTNSGRTDREGRVFSRSDQPHHEPGSWRGINETIASSSFNQEIGGEVKKGIPSMSREASSGSMSSFSKAAQGTWKKGSRLLESLRWKRPSVIFAGSSA